MTFAEMKSHEKRHSVLYFGFFLEQHWYIPDTVTRQTLGAAAESVKTQGEDNAGIRRALYDLYLTTGHAKMDSTDRDAMLMLYTKRLSPYPPAIVQIVLERFSERERFFPAWADVVAELDTLVGWRTQIIGALRRMTLQLKA